MARRSYQRIIAFTLGLVIWPVLVMAQGGRGGWFGERDQDSLSLLRSEAVIKELSLSDEQKQQLRHLAHEVRMQVRQTFAENPNLKPDARRRRWANSMKRIRNDAQAKIDKMLLPAQRDRLRQIALQMDMRRGGPASHSAVESISKALDLSEDQQKQLAQRAEEIRMGLREEISQATRQAEAKLLSELTPEQQKQLRELTGDEFHVPPPSRRWRGGPRPPGRDADSNPDEEPDRGRDRD